MATQMSFHGNTAGVLKKEGAKGTRLSKIMVAKILRGGNFTPIAFEIVK